MQLITVSGPPSSGKTSVILQTIKELNRSQLKIGVLKFDCLTTDDDKLYEAQGVDSRVGLSGSLCPDHFFVSNIDDCVKWGLKYEYDILISESAGLCNRCSPYIEGSMAICIIDNLMGINTPKKIGPMLKRADVIVITKGDIVSQAEREIFAFRIRQANPDAIILHVNGITGQGAGQLAALFQKAERVVDLEGKELRVSMPSALCSYCLGEKVIGHDKKRGNVKKMKLEI